MFQLWYDNDEECPFKDFKKGASGSGYFKTIPIDQVVSPYLIISYGKIKDLKFRVLTSKQEEMVLIASRNPEIAAQLNLNEVNTNWFTKHCPKNEIALIWEERIQITHAKKKYGSILELEDIWKTMILQDN